VAGFKYFGTVVTDQNYIHEIKGRLNSGDACYKLLAVQNCKGQNIQHYIFACYLCECEIWSLTLRKEHRVVFVSFIDTQLNVHYSLEVPILVSSVFLKCFHFT
jgi:hypothetical protein